MAVSVTTLISRLLPDLHTDVITNSVSWTECELIVWADSAVKRLARLAGVFVTRDTSITAATSTATYALPSRHLSTIRVTLNGSPLVSADTHSLSAKTGTFESTTGTPKRWYGDKITVDRIGLEPVPNSGSNGHTLAVIYHSYPTELDCPKVNTSIPVPAAVADYIESCMLMEANLKESDLGCPEVSQHLKEHTAFIESVILNYWGPVA